VRRRRHDTVLTERVELERSLVTRLSHVEMCFDRTAFTLCEHDDREDPHAAANTTGRWMAEQCRRQLRARSRAGQAAFFVPEEWLTAARAQRIARQCAKMPSLPLRMRRVAEVDGSEVVVNVPGKRARPPQPAPALAVTRTRRLTAADGTAVVVTLPGPRALPTPTPAPALALAA
jgi:hypothetical protein